MNKPVYTRHEAIAKYVRQAILDGRTITSIVDSANAKYELAPPTYRTFVRIYKKDIVEAQDELKGGIGRMVMDRAKESDKILELLARSRGDFNPIDKVAMAEVDGDDLDEDSAVKDLMRLLGKDVDDDEGETS